jgi:subtilase family protein
MRPIPGLAMAVALVFCAPSTSFAREQADPDREVIVQLTGDAMILPAGAMAASPAGLAHVTSDLASLLQEHGVDRVRRFRARLDGVSKTRKETHEAPGLSRTYVLHTQTSNRAALIADLRARPDVKYAEPNARIELMGIPNDVSFVNQWNLQNGGQYGGAVGADIHVSSAWDLHTGSSSELIGIVGEGANVTSHPEFSGRLSGNISGGEPVTHATNVAGIAAATGNNGQGIAGVNWQCGIRSDNGPDGDLVQAANDIHSSVEAGAKVVNNSWAQEAGTGWSYTIANALVWAFNRGAILTCGVPSTEHTEPYPSGYFDGSLTLNVSACNNQGLLTPYQLSGFPHVVAPGGTTDLLQRGIYTTDGSSGYAYVAGTSYAVPHATGAVSLLRSYAAQNFGLNLAIEDIKLILAFSSDDVPATGARRLNVRNAMDFLRPPGGLVQSSAVGGPVVDSWGTYQQMDFHAVTGLEGYNIVLARQYRVERQVTLTYQGTGTHATHYTRDSHSVGFSGSSPTNYGYPPTKRTTSPMLFPTRMSHWARYCPQTK